MMYLSFLQVNPQIDSKDCPRGYSANMSILLGEFLTPRAAEDFTLTIDQFLPALNSFYNEPVYFVDDVLQAPAIILYTELMRSEDRPNYRKYNTDYQIYAERMKHYSRMRTGPNQFYGWSTYSDQERLRIFFTKTP